MRSLMGKLIILYIFVCVYACSGIKPNVINPYNPQIILTDNDLSQRLGHRFILFFPKTKTITYNSVDLSIFGWDTCFRNSRFGEMHGTEFVHYNPVTKDVIFFLYTIPSGEGDRKPKDVLPDPPFRFAIYKTDINFTAPKQILISTSNDITIDHTVLDPIRNTLLLDVHSYRPENKQEIWKFEIASGKIKVIAQTVPMISESGELIDSSDLRISSDGRQLFQLLLYGQKNEWWNQTLYLSKIDLINSTYIMEKIDSGDGFVFEITGLSLDSRVVSYYTEEEQEFTLWVKDLKKGNPIKIPTTKINNLNIFTSPDGTKILAGLESDWEYYNLSTKTFHHTYIEFPYLWDPSGRYIVGMKNNKYVVFDIQTEKDLEIPIDANRHEYWVESAQWR